MAPSTPDKNQQLVQAIFNRIAARYDLLNRVISFHIDSIWRKKAVAALGPMEGTPLLLDLGTGTGDLALAAARQFPSGRIVGLDFSPEMLRLAREKTRRAALGRRASYVLGSALNPPLKERRFDAVMTAFVLRNVTDLEIFFERAFRLLKPGGKLVSVDMFPPVRPPFSWFYSVYFYRLVPWIGALLARDHGAYRYLSDSVRTFWPPEKITELVWQAGFEKITLRRFLSGAVCLHLAERPGGRQSR